MIRKLAIFIFMALFLVVLAIWSPWNNWNLNIYNFFGIENVDKLSSLKIKSLAGELDIYVDHEFQGSVTDNEDFADIGSLTSGTHVITLQRKPADNHYVFERTINFEPGVDVVTAYDLGPNEKFSEGHLFYTKKNFANDGKPRLYVYSVPDMTKVFIDGIFIAETPLRNSELDVKTQHKIKLQKPGYEDLEFTILPEELAEREKLVNFDLIIEAKLFLKPIKVVTQ